MLPQDRHQDAITDDRSTLRFTNVQDLFKTIDSTARDSLTITHVSLHRFLEIESARERRRRKVGFRHYDSDSQILIVTIPTALHERLHSRIYDKFFVQISNMGLDDSWVSIASTMLPAQQGGNSRRWKGGKEGDSSGGPMPERETLDAWPTLVIEAGVSETLAQLRLGMRRWVSISNHEVKIVLLAKFNGNQITLEKWEEEEPLQTHVANSSALVLSFRLLFLKDPGSREGDVVFSVEELQKYARLIWR
ncbi:hypothetical protein QBC43DRAFT_341545 [Cladorrhinum sp. PSN259]|nr:hypothetical protein QBC43DRAFT_341545 [Cladorrhinum sp. PSN259]